MSTKPNHRRQQERLQDNGPRWEGGPNDGGHGVAKARRGWKRIGARSERRTGQRSKAFLINGGRSAPRPEIDEET